MLLGGIALLVLLYSNAGKLPSALSALCIALVAILNVIGIFYAIQFANKIDLNIIYAFMYVYHVNVLLVSAIACRKHMKTTKRPAIALALVSAVAVFEVAFAIMGMGFTAPVKAFTETDGWVFSRQTESNLAET